MSRRDRVHATHTRRAAARSARNNAGCLLGLVLLPVWLLKYGRGSGGIGPRSTHRLLGPTHRAGGRKPPGGWKPCGLLLLVPPALATLGGYAGWLTGGVL